ncbi:MAG: response regulator [Rhodospirillales bacterium]|nr:response regulator [Rhodospirillales bacterium]
MSKSTNKEANSILVVDDDPDILKFLVDILEDEINLSFASSGIKALQNVREHQPDLILLDVIMPKMDGFETCRQLKSDPALKNIPVIFLSASNSKEDIAEGLKLGAVDYITKPFDTDLVISKVKSQLAQISAFRANTAESPKAPQSPRGKRRTDSNSIDRRTVNSPRTDRRGSPASPPPQATVRNHVKSQRQKTLTMALIAFLLLGGTGFFAVKFYNSGMLTSSIDENWPFSSRCPQSPVASWWGTTTHFSMVEYVNTHHSGDWNPYIDKWANQTNKMQNIYERDSTAKVSDGTTLSGETLRDHIEKLKKRTAVARCLAKEARSLKKS